jgi:hypothetical protein
MLNGSPTEKQLKTFLLSSTIPHLRNLVINSQQAHPLIIPHWPLSIRLQNFLVWLSHRLWNNWSLILPHSTAPLQKSFRPRLTVPLMPATVINSQQIYFHLVTEYRISRAPGLPRQLSLKYKYYYHLVATPHPPAFLIQKTLPQHTILYRRIFNTSHRAPYFVAPRSRASGRPEHRRSLPETQTRICI